MSKKSKQLIFLSTGAMLLFVLGIFYVVKNQSCTYVDTSGPEPREKTFYGLTQGRACERAIFICRLYASKEHCKLKP